MEDELHAHILAALALLEAETEVDLDVPEVQDILHALAKRSESRVMGLPYVGGRAGQPEGVWRITRITDIDDTHAFFRMEGSKDFAVDLPEDSDAFADIGSLVKHSVHDQIVAGPDGWEVSFDPTIASAKLGRTPKETADNILKKLTEVSALYRRSWSKTAARALDLENAHWASQKTAARVDYDR